MIQKFAARVGRICLLLLCALPGAFVGEMRAQAQTAELRVFAAASLADALDHAIRAYSKEEGAKAVGVYAASGALARQIDAGAPADLFVSAHPEWIEWLRERQALSGPPKLIASNTLVVAAYEPSAIADVAALLKGADYIAVADLRAAPAGRYAAQALAALGLYDELKDTLIEASDARAAAAWVARGEASVGLFYLTDALGAGLHVAANIEPSAHEPIIYIAAPTSNRSAEIAAFLEFLVEGEGAEIMKSHGFAPPPQENAGDSPSEQ